MMSNNTLRWFASLSLLAMLCCARPAGAGVDLTRALASPGINPGLTSIVIADAASGTELASHHPEMTLNPASCAKLLTSAAALAALGPQYRFPTRFYADRAPASGTIGTLYVSGTGDPMFVTEEVTRMGQELRSRGVARVTDGIVIDNGFFDSLEFPRKGGNDGRNYTAKTSAVAVNFNGIGVSVGPGPRAGAPGVVKLDPPITGFRIVNKLVTRPKFFATISFSTGPEGEEIIVNGRVPAGFTPQTLSRSVEDPVPLAGELIRYLFGQSGIEIRGPVRAGPVPQTAAHLMDGLSRPLSELAASMNKHSNNFMAEQILKHLGAVRYSPPGSTEKGVAAVEDYLASIGIPRGSYEVENGSGLSERTRISAAQLVRVLVAIYHNKAIRDDFISSLSVLGVDGTTRHWGRQAKDLAGNAYVKTGTINGVSTLAGYLPMADGRIAAFAILANGIPKGAWTAHQAQLDLVRAISQGGMR